MNGKKMPYTIGKTSKEWSTLLVKEVILALSVTLRPMVVTTSSHSLLFVDKSICVRAGHLT